MLHAAKFTMSQILTNCSKATQIQHVILFYVCDNTGPILNKLEHIQIFEDCSKLRK